MTVYQVSDRQRDSRYIYIFILTQIYIHMIHMMVHGYRRQGQLQWYPTTPILINITILKF